MSSQSILYSSVVLFGLQALGGLPLHRQEGTPAPGPPRQIPHTHERAGQPLDHSHHLDPSVTPNGRGYYVGGGNALHGESRSPHEGTWGYDDTGFRLFPRRTQLRWNHGQRDQGGTGSYQTDFERPGHRRKHN